MSRRSAAALITVFAAVVLTGCGGSTPAPAGNTPTAHTHTTLPAGDGTEASYVGYSIKDLRLPAKAGEPGRVSFRIGTYRGVPQTKFFTEQTKKMHVYVVRDDLSVFRHVHPTMAADGTWSGNLTVPEAGRYRLVTEFLAVDEGGNPDHLILGESRDVSGPRNAAERPEEAEAVPAAGRQARLDGVTLTVHGPLRSGPDSENNRMRIGISYRGAPADPGTYLGVYAHLTGFAASTGGMVHMHPLGAPVTKGKESVLTFHTAFPEPGDYRVFVQARISGIVRTVPITLKVS